MLLSECAPDQLWLQEYPIHFAGCDFDARMAVISVSDTELLTHSPCEIDSEMKKVISELGDVASSACKPHHRYTRRNNATSKQKESHKEIAT